jgi:hypothetical protein
MSLEAWGDSDGREVCECEDVGCRCCAGIEEHECNLRCTFCGDVEVEP